MEKVLVEKVIVHKSGFMGSKGRVRSFVITCPYCGKHHTHSGGTEDDDINACAGYRGPHCTDINRNKEDYYLVVPDDVKIEYEK